MSSTLLQSSIINTPTLHRLSNGLTIVAQQMPVEAVNLSLWVNVGSAAESDAINGMAHFLEHMVFKGTEQLTLGEFERRIEERGALTNAATSHDYTQYYITTAPKDFAQLAPLQIDVALNPSIPDEEFERERLVVLEEIRRSEDNPRRRTFQRAMEMAFDQLPYRRQILGPVEVISQLKPQQMRDFHAQWYQPQSITAVAVGNLPVEELIQIVADGFTTASSSRRDACSTPLPATGETPLLESSDRREPPLRLSAALPHSPLPSELPFTEIVRREYIDEHLTQARLVMVWRVPGLAELERTYALDVLAAILGHGRTSRLVRDLREEQGLVSHISVSNMTQELQGTFYISAQLPIENLEKVEALVAQHIHTIQTQTVQESEVARVRTQVANRFVFGNETPSDRANLYGYYQSLVGDLAPALNYPAAIQAIDAAAIQVAAQQYLSANAYGIVVLKPDLG